MYRLKFIYGVFVVLWVQLAAAQTTEFSFQAEFLDNGSPANGTYDFIVELWDAEMAGSLLESMAFDDEQINDGLVQLVLDFGDVPFSGEDRWLQVLARPGVSTDPMSPIGARSKMLSAPYAIQSAFTDQGGLFWAPHDDGIAYADDVFIGDTNTSTDSVLTVNSDVSESPLRVKISGGTKLIVRSNGGMSVGVNAAAPENGLRVAGDVELGGSATQTLGNHGLVKAGTEIQCGAGISGGSDRFFNTINGSDFSTAPTGVAGGCAITVPFDISNAFFTVSAYAMGGVVGFESMIASCSAASATTISCQLHQISGANTSLDNGVVQLMIY